MQCRLFSIPATGDVEGEASLNTFLRTHRAESMHRELVQTGAAAAGIATVDRSPHLATP
jgi:hypothetical protein